MDLNYLLFIIAILNLAGDLYNSYRYRTRLPTWIRIFVASAFGSCVIAWFTAQEIAGYFAATVLLVYLITMKTYSRGRSSGPKKPKPVTWFLIGVNCVGFLVQWYFDATLDLEELVHLGALYTPLFSAGEWWRIFSAQVLHLGVLHLACNMLGLSFVGPIVEHSIGRFWYVVGYVLSGTGGMLIAITLYTYDRVDTPTVLVGASANVLGLVGIAAASALRKYRVSGSAMAKAQLSTMAQIVLLQVVFDSLVPQVSSRAHIAGAAAGFIFGLIVSYLPAPPTSRRGPIW